MTRNGGPNLIDASVTVSPVYDNRYRISGFTPLTIAAGEYEITVSASNVADLAGNPGAGFAVDRWVANDPPVIGSIGPAVTYTEGDGPLQLLANTTTVSDLEVMFPGGSLRVLGGRGGHDRLTIRSAGTGPGQISRDGDNVRYQGVLIGVVSGGVGTNPLFVDLNQSATIDAATALLKAITFHNVNTGNLRPEPRTMRFELEDGAGGIGVATKTITVVPVNDAPLLYGISGSSGYRVGERPIQIAPSATVIDPDSANFDGGRLVVEITQGAGAGNRIFIRGAYTVNANNEVFRLGVKIGSVNAGGGIGTTKLELTFNANANSLVVQQLIRQLRFRTVDAAVPGNRSLAFTLSDGDGDTSAPVTRTIFVST